MQESNTLYRHQQRAISALALMAATATDVGRVSDYTHVFDKAKQPDS